MARHNSPANQRRRAERNQVQAGITDDVRLFGRMVRRRKNRSVTIISQGDSWFDYPMLLQGFDNGNIMDWICEWVQSKGIIANIMRLEDNGAEAIELAAGEDFEDFEEAVEATSNLDFVLLSMGGNDFGGSDDIFDFVRNEVEGDETTPESWFYLDRVEETMTLIIESYKRHIKTAVACHPEVNVIAHCYDYFQPSEVGIRILWNAIQISCPWVSIGMHHIPKQVQLEMVTWLMQDLRTRLQALNEEFPNFHLVDTQNTLKPGKTRDWTNEIHPTSDGFKRIAKKVYTRMKELDSRLPKVR